MVLVDVGPVVVLTTGHTTTTGMLPLRGCQLVSSCDPKSVNTYVLSDTSVSGGNVTAVLAGLCQSVRQLLVIRMLVSGDRNIPGGHIDDCCAVVSIEVSLSTRIEG
jgi:hypothetical protein